MIWFLLYPFRGTTEPPKLDPKHPIRSNFTRYGNYAARHPVIVLLISVAVASILVYPFPFLYTNNFKNGTSNLPHHVWTSAQPYEGDIDLQPDVIMRSIWVHGSFMKALQPDVLQTALDIQDELLGPTIDFSPRRSRRPGRPSDANILVTDLAEPRVDPRDSFHAINGLSNSSWFFHSPLQYWSCSAERIAADDNILATVNKNSHQSTSMNVTLRPSIVFSGKRFEDHQLIAADALVITLIHMLDSPVGQEWERRAEELARRGSDDWRFIPSNGKPQDSTLYEFRFQPLSLQEDLLLAILYSVLIMWFFANLLKMRALKSRVGLIFATCAQVVVSMMSSFTICAVLKIDLSKIPREFYPLVIVVFGSQNICNLVNTVITAPADRSTSTRIGEALGQDGPIVLATLTQNIGILWVLSAVDYPPITAFATFVGLAMIFDYFYLLTFFTAVLSIDVRRTELSDSLSRAAARNNRQFSPAPKANKSWTYVFWGKLSASTRIAGTILMIGLILIAQWHFFEDENVYQIFQRITRSVMSHSPPAKSASFLSVDIHQARSPTAWLKMQDHETAHEVINVVKPYAHSIVARVYDPFIFVLNGADRTPNQLGVRPFLPAAYDFVRHQFGALVTVLLVVLACVALLMNYLLWDETPEMEDDDRPDDQPLLSIRALPTGHHLDIALLTTSNRGVLATVGLDRCVRIWDIRKGVFSYIVKDIASNLDPFPILALAIDNDSNWLALLSSKDKVYLWNIPERRWGPVMDVEVKGRAPAAFYFGYDKFELIDPIIVARHNGWMTELHMENHESKSIRICHSPLVCVRPHFEQPTPQYPNPPPRIVTSSKKGCVHIASLLETGWVSEGLDTLDIIDEEIQSILPLPVLSSFLAVRRQSIDLVDIFTHKVTHTFKTNSIKSDTLRCFHSTRRRPQCGSVGLASLTLAYACEDTGACIIQSYLPERDGDTICFRDPLSPGSKTCCLWKETKERYYEIQNPGEWRALQVGYVVGVRKVESKAAVSTIALGLRRRGAKPRTENIEDDTWEVWSISSKGDKSVIPLCGANENPDYLLYNDLGPMEIIGKRSIAFVIGNVVKVVTIGHDTWDISGDNDDMAFVGMATNRKKKTHLSSRKKPG